MILTYQLSEKVCFDPSSEFILDSLCERPKGQDVDFDNAWIPETQFIAANGCSVPFKKCEL